MRVVASSEGSRNFRQADLDRHLEAMSHFVERVRETNTPASCTLILRSAASAPAQVLTLMKDTLAEAGIQARVLLAKLEPEQDLRQLYAALTTLSPEADSAALIRWARNPRLLDAHEQAVYGHDMCWSGDAMRRDADKRNALALMETTRRKPRCARRWRSRRCGPRRCPRRPVCSMRAKRPSLPAPMSRRRARRWPR
ncbi:hypothetical protein [Methyloceanibacter marginalis]|uniref:hypothetical protein n=1 Tax=Methyloceanibacter marginalis TaxID=1774971 RepID=UPI00114D1121|nr:hypothetical protein [Methyloceanibacter marginalis]